MKVLILNNHTKHLDELSALFSDADIVEKEKLKEEIDLSPYDILVISGGSGVSTIINHPDDYRIESNIIKEATIPILGICLGSEIMTHTFGGALQKLEFAHRGIIRLAILDKKLRKYLGTNLFEVHESHRIGIQEVPKDFIICAISEHGVEIIKHKTRPLLGIQFHPEISKNELLLEWIFETLG